MCEAPRERERCVRLPGRERYVRLPGRERDVRLPGRERGEAPREREM
jgi:hypothetical protein